MKRTAKWLGRKGVIYILQVRGKGQLKIGFTENDPMRRVAAIQSASPYELELISSFAAIAQDELHLHKALEQHRIRGEWYRPSEEVMGYLEGHCPELRAKRPKSRRPNVEKALDAFGGLHNVAKICGVGISAVCQWHKGIPPRHHRTLLKYAEEHNIAFTLDDFFEPTERRAA
jgi:hypothetical protein